MRTTSVPKSILPLVANHPPFSRMATVDAAQDNDVDRDAPMAANTTTGPCAAKPPVLGDSRASRQMQLELLP